MQSFSLKSDLALGSSLGLTGAAAMVLSLILGFSAPETARILVWLAGLMALAGAAILLSTGMRWYKRVKRDEAGRGVDSAGDA